jgi:hypothetical protein
MRLALACLVVWPLFGSDFKPLFDGRTTDGWIEITGKSFPTMCWKVEDGCLKAFPNPNGMQDIRTVETFRNFDLEWEWKILVGGNSGVKYLVQKVDEWTAKGRGRQARARGFEYQLADDINEEAVNDPSRACGSLYSVLAPTPRVRPTISSFNRSRLVVNGSHVEHWLNGVKVVEYETTGPKALALLENVRKGGKPAFPQGGPISLQNHASEAWFRNIRIRRLAD